MAGEPENLNLLPEIENAIPFEKPPTRHETPMLFPLGSVVRDASWAALLRNDNQACVTVPTSGNFESHNRHLRVRYYSIYESIARHSHDRAHRPDELLPDGLAKRLDDPKNVPFVSRFGMV